MSIYEQVTDNIVSMLEQGDAPPWRKEWTSEPLSLPYNGVTNHEYQGINIWNLMITGWAKNYSSNQWATYKQWNSIGGRVRKGSRSSTAVFFKPLMKTDDSGKEYQINIARSFNVFNKDQVDIDTPDDTPSVLDRDSIELQGISLEISDSLGVKLSQGQPAYMRQLDIVYMPNITDFTTPEAFFSAMAHECSHATGHDNRLNRTFGKRFGDDAYAMEELTAELSAAYICAKYGIAYDLEQHVSYLSAWLRRLKEDSKAIFTVAAASQRAADYISDSVASHRLVNEQESELGRLMA